MTEKTSRKGAKTPVAEMNGCQENEIARDAVGTQVEMPVPYHGMRFDLAFRADLMVDDRVIVELKSVEQMLPVHGRQRLTYLRVADGRPGRLINFGAPLLKDGLKRVVNGLEE